MNTTYESLSEALREGEQPTDTAGYVFQAIGAAGRHAPFGPGTGVFREDLARAIGDWAVQGIEALTAP